MVASASPPMFWALLQMGATLASAALSLVWVAFSHVSSALPAVVASSPLNRSDACRPWHLMIPETAFANAFPNALAHFRWSFVSLTHPASSAAHELLPPSLQSKCCPGAGGVAHASPVASENANAAPMKTPIDRLISSSLLWSHARPALVWFPTTDAVSGPLSIRKTSSYPVTAACSHVGRGERTGPKLRVSTGSGPSRTDERDPYHTDRRVDVAVERERPRGGDREALRVARVGRAPERARGIRDLRAAHDAAAEQWMHGELAPELDL